MTTLSVDPLDLMTFFECEPSCIDKNELWDYNDCLYKYSNNNSSLSFSLAPHQKDIRIIHEILGAIVFEFNAMGIVDITFHKDELLNKSLKIVITNEVIMTITLKPIIKITQSHKI